MDGAPTTPPRRRPTGHGHLHKRTSSKIVLLSPPTPPHGAPPGSSAPFRISAPESPDGAGRFARAKLTPPPEERDECDAGVAQQQPPVWMRDKGARKARGVAGWSRAKTALVACALIATVLLLDRGRRRGADESAWWEASGGGDERETYGRANDFVASPVVSHAAAAADAITYYPAPPPPLPGAGGRPPPPPADRFRKVVVGKVHDLRPPPPAVAQDEEAAMSENPSRHNLEVTSATDPDTARKFLLVGWMGEQETKAQAHLYQLGLLALSLNRTLVLPSVKRSRFGTCYPNPFSLYYAADTFVRFGIPYVTSNDFWAWTDRQRAAPSAQVVSFVRGERGPVEGVAISPQKMCLAERNLDFSAFEGKAFFSPMIDWKSVQAREKFGEEVVRDLLAQERLPDGAGSAASSGERKSPAVLVVQYNLRYPFLTPSAVTALSPFPFAEPAPYSYFPYSSHWTELGHSIASSLSPFLAIHWRTETLAVDRLLPCGETLVRSIRAVKDQHPEIKTVYLATDYPLEVLRTPGKEKGATAHSGTMTKTLTPAHHAAMRQFLAALEGDDLVEGGADGQGLRITTFMDEQRRVEWPAGLDGLVGEGGLEDVDGAIVGIVDKIVLTNAQLFYAGLPVAESPSHGCAKNSQFTTQVISGRRDLLAAKSGFWSEVEHFALPGGAGKARKDT